MSENDDRARQPEEHPKEPNQQPPVPDVTGRLPGSKETDDGDIVEDAPPPVEKFFNYRRPPPHIDAVRRNLAVGLVVLLAAMVAFGAVGWFQGHDLQTYVLLFSPVVTLVGTVLGFYFSNNGK